MDLQTGIRAGVIESLPEARQICEQDLREKVYDAWTFALSENGYTSIEEIPFSALPDVLQGTNLEKTQTDHLRSVARMATAMTQELSDSFPEFDVDMDEVIAGSLCHDLGKPFEYSAAHRQNWRSNPHKAGNPSIRHPVYGVYVALTVGLPETITHICGAHSAEGENVERSLVAQIIHYADEAFWRILEKAGIVT